MKNSRFGFLCTALAFAAALAMAAPTPAHADALNVNAQTGTSYTFLNTDCSKLVTFSNAAAVAVTLPQASSGAGAGSGLGTFMPPCAIKALNRGAGTVTITPTTSTIAGASTLVLSTGQAAEIVSDGANYQVASGTGGTSTGGSFALNTPLVTFGNAAGAPTHVATAQLTAPALTSCGTSPSIVGTDEAGTVTMGTSATGCVITFNVAYTGVPHCVVNWVATPLASQSYVVAAASITTTQTSTSNNVLTYICRARAGG